MKRITNWILTTTIGLMMGFLTERWIFGQQMREKMESLKAELNATRGQLQVMRQELSEKSAENDRLSAKLEASQIENDRLQYVQSNFHAAQTEILTLQSKLSEATTQIAHAQAKPNDLRRIEGLGAKSDVVLKAAGVITYTQLAEMSVERLTEILTAGGMRRLNSIDTWAEQATLAAEGNWDALKVLQDELIGGRRIPRES